MCPYIVQLRIILNKEEKRKKVAYCRDLILIAVTYRMLVIVPP